MRGRGLGSARCEHVARAHVDRAGFLVGRGAGIARDLVHARLVGIAKAEIYRRSCDRTAAIGFEQRAVLVVAKDVAGTVARDACYRLGAQVDEVRAYAIVQPLHQPMLAVVDEIVGMRALDYAVLLDSPAPGVIGKGGAEVVGHQFIGAIAIEFKVASQREITAVIVGVWYSVHGETPGSGLAF